MAIEKYTTKGFILREYEQGESDKVYKLFTEEFGLLFVLAKGVRKLESKLRFHLKVGKEVTVTLVKGKEVWRLTGVESQSRETHEDEHLVTSLLERFVRGEFKQKNLFKHTEEYFNIEPSLYSKDVRVLTLYYVFLVDLGYADGLLAGASSMDDFFSFSFRDHMTHVFLRKDAIKKHVHTVLSEMQL